MITHAEPKPWVLRAERSACARANAASAELRNRNALPAAQVCYGFHWSECLRESLDVTGPATTNPESRPSRH